MLTLFFIAMMILLPLVGMVAIVGAFRWLMKRFTGYDPSYSDEAIAEGHHVHMKKDVDFAQLTDWDHETGFANKDTRQKRKPRKQKSTPHYDRLHAQDQTEFASETLNNLALDDHAEPIPLHALIEQSKVEKRKQNA
ncbi:MAG: hypothetical protein AAFQ07_10380 [Chloroflexota bacterium]